MVGEYYGSVLLTFLNLPYGGFGMIIKIWINNFGNLSFSWYYGVFGSSEMRRYLNASAKGREEVAELCKFRVSSWLIAAKNIKDFNIQDCIRCINGVKRRISAVCNSTQHSRYTLGGNQQLN